MVFFAAPVIIVIIIIALILLKLLILTVILLLILILICECDCRIFTPEGGQLLIYYLHWNFINVFSCLKFCRSPDNVN